MATGIKDSVELLVLFRDGVKVLKASMTDGKIDWKDIPKVWALKDKATAAVQGLKLVAVEAKDYDAAEVSVLLGLVAEIVGEAWPLLDPAA
jgi:hypothetical protein